MSAGSVTDDTDQAVIVGRLLVEGDGTARTATRSAPP
jgi:ADP-ribosylglycohydrolase